MMAYYNDRVEEAGGEFAEAYAKAIELVQKTRSEGGMESGIAEALYEAILQLRSADSEFHSAREKALKDLTRRDGSNPGETLSSHGLGFPFTYGWGAQLDMAAASYDSALRNFWSIYQAATTWGLW